MTTLERSATLSLYFIHSWSTWWILELRNISKFFQFPFDIVKKCISTPLKFRS